MSIGVDLVQRATHTTFEIITTESECKALRLYIAVDQLVPLNAHVTHKSFTLIDKLVKFFQSLVIIGRPESQFFSLFPIQSLLFVLLDKHDCSFSKFPSVERD
jgi:hypothetical protein